MQTSGLVLDMYDDFKGEVLRSIYPTPAGIPDFIKTAKALSAEERDRLPDDAFALVLINGDQTLRKFACIDEGGTALSVQYFLKNAHKLPPEAQKVAAQNLAIACSWYDLAVPEPLSKIAGLPKVGEVVGTTTMPAQSPPTSPRAPDKTTINKTASELRRMMPHVEVTSKKTASAILTTESSVFALPMQRKYPLDNYVHVKTASGYFDDFYKDFSPAERHEYAVNLVKRANALGIEVSETARRYGAETYASDEDIKVAYEIRDKTCAWDEEARGMLHELFEKRAELDPEVFALALTEFDKVAGLNHQYDRGVPDAFYSTFGDAKLAEEKEFSEVIGNDVVTGCQLSRLAKSPPHALIQTFDPDFCKEFRKDPVGIFKSMPVDQRKILARMAAEAA